MRVRMRLIAEPPSHTASTFQPDFGTDPVVVRGSGANDFSCGHCDAVLLEGVFLGQVENVAVRCASCLSWNAVPVIAGDG